MFDVSSFMEGSPNGTDTGHTHLHVEAFLQAGVFGIQVKEIVLVEREHDVFLSKKSSATGVKIRTQVIDED